MPGAESVDQLGLKVTGADDPEGGGGGDANVGGEAGVGVGVGITAPEASTSKGVASKPFILSEGLPPRASQTGAADTAGGVHRYGGATPG